MLSNVIEIASKKYSKSPLAMIYVEFMRIFSIVIALFAVFAISFLAILALTSLNLMSPYGLPIVAALALLQILLLAYMCSAYKGALINELLAADSGRVRFRNFLNHAFLRTPRYFIIDLVKFVITLIAAVPFALAIYFLKLDPFSLITVLLVLVFLLIAVSIRYVFSFALIAAVVKGASPPRAIKVAFSLLLKNSIPSLSMYFLYLIIAATILIPFLNLLTVFMLHPILYSAMINFYKTRSR